MLSSPGNGVFFMVLAGADLQTSVPTIGLAKLVVVRLGVIYTLNRPPFTLRTMLKSSLFSVSMRLTLVLAGVADPSEDDSRRSFPLNTPQIADSIFH